MKIWIRKLGDLLLKLLCLYAEGSMHGGGFYGPPCMLPPREKERS